MSEPVFVPKHNWFSIILWGILFALLGVVFSWGGVVIQNWFMIVFGFGFIALGIFSVVSRSTKIIIHDKNVVVRHLLFPDLVFQSENFSGFNGNAFVFGVRGIMLKDMINSQEFVYIFSSFLAAKNIQPSPTHDAEISRANLVIGYAFVPLLVISFILVSILKKYFSIQMDVEVVIGIALLLLVSSVLFVLIRKTKSSK